MNFLERRIEVLIAAAVIVSGAYFVWSVHYSKRPTFTDQLTGYSERREFKLWKEETGNWILKVDNTEVAKLEQLEVEGLGYRFRVLEAAQAVKAPVAGSIFAIVLGGLGSPMVCVDCFQPHVNMPTLWDRTS
ncbi:MAG: hypothetical protein CFE43_05165 [Burkholderiales bacterium PBB3]|nr:MAG: hypothetical protein CFE43_05165 [Burkholderiales bacterium PBB3]